MIEVCACGHAWANHLVRKYGSEVARQARIAGETLCGSCQCYDYTPALEAEDRMDFRAAQKLPHGNFGSGHPLMLGVARARDREHTVDWKDLQCRQCSAALKVQEALVYDSWFFCDGCFVKLPGVHCG